MQTPMIQQVREGFRKKTRKKSGLLPNGAGGSRRVVKSQTSIIEALFWKRVFALSMRGCPRKKCVLEIFSG